jgi:hypothetical protein
MQELITSLLGDPRFIQAGGAALTGLVMAVAAFVLRRSEKTAIAFAALALGFFVLGGVLWAVQREALWRWILSGLPCFVIINHAVFLFIVRRRLVPSATGKARDMLAKRPETAFLVDILEQLSMSSTRHFSVPALLLRYFVPALFVGGLGVGLSNLLTDAELLTAIRLPHDAVVGAQYGLAGAYIYVLLYLGRRSFQQDITAGAATWSAVTLAAGPLLAGAVGMLAPVPADSTGGKAGALGLLFFAGFAPRLVVSFIEGLLQRIYLSKVLPTGYAPRTVPIGLIRGITREVGERLSEEGIDDAHALAKADPVALLRNTSFDRRQIVGWIDSAILITTLPDAWQALEKQGITGAIDLAWHASPHQAEKALHPAADDAVPPRIFRLAEAVKIDPHLLRDIIERLRQDAQVLLIWCLYQLESGESEGELEERAPASRAADASIAA